MSIDVKISPILARYSGNQRTAKVKGSNVGECLDHLVTQFPDLKKALFDKNGRLHRYIDVYVNQKSTYPEELAKTVKDGDNLQIMMIIAGG